MAQAREQEMTALVEEMSARVKEAEAEVPRALAEAFAPATSASRPPHRNAPGRRYPSACGPKGSPYRQGYHFASLTGTKVQLSPCKSSIRRHGLVPARLIKPTNESA